MSTEQFTETGKTIEHRGRTYKILLPQTETNRELAPYVIEGKNGAQYALTRNAPRPEHLFGIRFNGKMSVLPGWFTDNGGELKSLG
jgi:hypothetical protein